MRGWLCIYLRTGKACSAARRGGENQTLSREIAAVYSILGVIWQKNCVIYVNILPEVIGIGLMALHSIFIAYRAIKHRNTCLFKKDVQRRTRRTWPSEPHCGPRLLNRNIMREHDDTSALIYSRCDTLRASNVQQHQNNTPNATRKVDVNVDKTRTYAFAGKG